MKDNDNINEFPPIPFEPIRQNWKEVETRECGEKLVPLGVFSDFSDCDTFPAYFDGANFLGKPVDRKVSLITHFVREGVRDHFKAAQELLGPGFYFRFIDTYRPLSVQQALYDAQKENLKTDHPEWTGEKLDEETQKYVSLPSPNKERGTAFYSPHSTGGVADLTLIGMSSEGKLLLEELEKKKSSGQLEYDLKEDEKAGTKIFTDWLGSGKKERWLSDYRYAMEKARIFKEYSSGLKMGTGFDHFGPEANIRYYEDLAATRKLSEKEKEVLLNRRFLYWTMKKAGFSNYPEEWWHWDHMYNAVDGKEISIYAGIELTEENKSFEKMKKDLYSVNVDKSTISA